jgi:hypothetical protein
MKKGLLLEFQEYFAELDTKVLIDERRNFLKLIETAQESSVPIHPADTVDHWKSMVEVIKMELCSRDANTFQAERTQLCG